MQESQKTVEKLRRAFTRKVLVAAIAVLIAAILLLSVLWLGSDDELGSDDDDLFSLSQVNGGVKCTILRNTASVWTAWHVQIYQERNDSTGYDSVWWDLNYTNLSTDNWTTETGDIRLLGDTVLRLYIVEVEGDGTIGQGDTIEVSALNSTEFLQDTVYIFKLGTGWLPISGTEYSMTFWFEDGNLETGPMEMIHIPY